LGLYTMSGLSDRRIKLETPRLPISSLDG